MKRTRDSTWVFTASPKRNEYLLTVDSDRHSAAGRVRVSNLNNSLNELDVSAYQDWEVGVESVSAPNNGEAFHSIDENNQCMGFFVLNFTRSGVGGRDYCYPVCYLPHERYSVQSLLADIRSNLAKMLLTTHSTEDGVNVVGEMFRVCVFNLHVDAVSDFVKLDSPGVNAFMKLFIKKLTLYKPGVDSKLVRMNVWFSSELKNFLGKFVLPTGWSPIAPPRRVIVHDVALDEVVFEVTFPSNVFPYLMTKIGVNPNMRSLMHILSDLVLPDSIGSNLGSIATCRLPIHADSIVLIPCRAHKVESVETKWGHYR